MVVVCCGSLLSNVPLSLPCNRHEAIGGTVYTTMLEKDEVIVGKIHHECSLGDGWKAAHESWPVKCFVFDWLNLEIWWLIHSFWRISPWIFVGLVWNKHCRILHWIKIVSFLHTVKNRTYHPNMAIVGLSI